jgi:hypothetical protein
MVSKMLVAHRRRSSYAVCSGRVAPGPGLVAEDRQASTISTCCSQRCRPAAAIPAPVARDRRGRMWGGRPRPEGLVGEVVRKEDRQPGARRDPGPAEASWGAAWSG